MPDESTENKTSGVHHFGIVVRNMKSAVERLESLGIGPFEPFDPNSLPPLDGELLYRGKPIQPRTKTYVAWAGGVMFELFEPPEEESPWREFLDTKGEGIHHIGILVDDIDEEIERLTKGGASIVLYGRWKGGGGGIYMDLGAGNIIVEIIKF